MNKRGQFYLIAAMIIIVIVTLFVVVFNYSEKQGSTKLTELGEELIIEAEKVIDYDTINDASEIDDFTQKFSTYAGSDVKIYYILGHKDSIEAYKYLDGEKVLATVEEIDEEIHITLDWIDYVFDLQPGENFYYVISQNINGETHVVTNK